MKYLPREQAPHCDWKGCACRQNAQSFLWLFPDYRLLWYEVPKCASSSIIKLFRGNARRVKPNQRQLRAARDYQSFAVVRNPWARMVSNWCMFSTSRQHKLRNMCGGKRPKTFSDFLDFAAGYQNHHWAPCVDFLPPHGVTWLCRLENLERDLAPVLKQAGLSFGQITKQNRTDHKPYAEYYTCRRDINIVAEMFFDDIELFGYTFGDAKPPC